MMTVVIMVARGRRTHGLFTTASDTAGSHWHLDNFSGKRCYKGRKRKRKVIARTPCLCDSLVAISSEGICQTREKRSYQGLNGRCHPPHHKVIESLITVNAKDCFCYNAILTKANSESVLHQCTHDTPISSFLFYSSTWVHRWPIILSFLAIGLQHIKPDDHNSFSNSHPAILTLRFSR